MTKNKGVLFLSEKVGELLWVNEESGDNGKYIGEIENGEPNGIGNLTYPDGKKYVGEFKDGERNGQGTFTHTDGRSKYVGEYKDGKPWNGTEYDKNGKIIGKFMNGWFDQ